MVTSQSLALTLAPNYGNILKRYLGIYCWRSRSPFTCLHIKYRSRISQGSLDSLGGCAWLAKFTPSPTTLLNSVWLCRYIRSDLSYLSSLSRYHRVAEQVFMPWGSSKSEDWTEMGWLDLWQLVSRAGLVKSWPAPSCTTRLPAHKRLALVA